MRVEARYNHDVNGYFICDAGRFGFSYSNGGSGHKKRPWVARVGESAVSAQTAFTRARESLGNIAEKYGPNAIAAVGSTRNSLESQCMLNQICRTRDWRGPVFFADPAKLRKTRSALEGLDGEIAVSMREIEKADFVIIAGADLLNEAGMAALAVRQASRRQATIVTIDPRPVFLPCDFEHIPAAPGEIELYLGMLAGKAVEKDSAGFEKDAKDFYRALIAEHGDSKLQTRIAPLAEQLALSKRPVIICGTDVTRETTPAFAADCVRLLRLAGRQAGLFYLLPGAGAFSSALLSGADGQAFADLVGDIENGLVRALVVVESDPFHYYPDRSRLDLAMSKLELLIALDYFPTETVNRASIFYPVSTIFETGSTYISQEGRAQFAQRVHYGGLPIWGGEHPPRLYRDFVPGGDHLPAWKALWKIAGVPMPDTGPGDISPGEFIPTEHTAFEGFNANNYPVDGIRILQGKSGNGNLNAPRGAGSLEKPKSSEGLELLMVEWMFGTTEFSAWSDSLDAGVTGPYMSMHSRDAERAGLSDGDRASVELDNGTLEIIVSVSDRTAEGVLVIPRHQSLDWRKMKGFSARVLPEKIRKA
jgi:NADH-quinone oxidoreductase subunit G